MTVQTKAKILVLDIDGKKRYFVSDDGRVFSLKKGGLKELKTRKNSEGYLRTKVYNQTVSVHRLVALAFCDNPFGLETVDHIDNCKDNNHYTNLRWLSREDNAGRAGLGTYKFVSPSGEVVEVVGLNKFCHKNGLTQANMSKVAAGLRPKHKGWTLYVG